MRVRGNPEMYSFLHNAPIAKIGGVASDVPSIWEPEVPDIRRFLGQLAGLGPGFGFPNPWVGWESPPSAGRADMDLSTGPGNGITCIYLDSEGEVRLCFSCP